MKNPSMAQTLIELANMGILELMLLGFLALLVFIPAIMSIGKT